MAQVNITKKEYKGWKSCIEISNGIVDLIATTDVGPRIIRYGFTGGKNEFCEVEEQLGKIGGSDWRIYGGHRLWHSPENMPRTYEPDNGKIQWKKRKNGISLSQPTEPNAQIKKDIEISLSEKDSSVTVIHKLTNKGLWPISLSLWALTVMAPGGIEIVPQVSRETGFLPNRMLSLWPYSKLNDPRVNWGGKYTLLKQDKTAKTPFKFGLPNEDGWAAYANGGNLFIKRYKHIPGAEYPDYASSYETYTCDFMTEMESLSPVSVLNPEDSITHTETWQLFKNIRAPGNEEDVEKSIVTLL